MYLLTWRNLWRNRRRTLITLSSVSFAVLLAIVMQSMQKGIFDHLVNNVVGLYYGYIQVHGQGYQDEPVLENSFEDQPALRRQLSLPGIRYLVPRLETFVLASAGNTTRGCMLAGIDAAAEDQLTGLSGKITRGKGFRNNQPGVLVAEGLAERLGITEKDTLILLGQGFRETMAAGKYPVCGLVHFGSPQLNNAMLFLPLPVARDFLSAPGRLTSLSVGIPRPADMEAVQAAIRQQLGPGHEVMNWKEMMPEIYNHIRADSSSYVVFSGILYLIIAFGLFGTLLMMTTERRREFGMFIAIGMKKTILARMLFLESLLISFMGVLAGMLIAWPILSYLRHYPIRLSGSAAEIYERFGFEALFPAALDPAIFLRQAAVVLLIAVITGLYPLWNIHRLNPVKAMRNA